MLVEVLRIADWSGSQGEADDAVCREDYDLLRVNLQDAAVSQPGGWGGF